MKNKGKHLNELDRQYIEHSLDNKASLKEIATHLSKDPTTISKEIKRHKFIRESRSDFKGGCVKRSKCIKQHLCGNSYCKLLCKKCRTHNCYKVCRNFEFKNCDIIKRFPHTCNGCERKYTCRLDKHFYRAKAADLGYKEALRETRLGINFTPDELKVIEDIVTAGIKKGQSLKHIYEANIDKIPCSLRTLYNLIDACIFEDVRNIDLRRKVKYKKRKKKKQSVEPSRHRENRSYEDYTKYVEENPELSIVQMDTVIGRPGGKALMTLFYLSCLDNVNLFT
ncbi:helix-turn-helix domain-containing protein [Acidaminobacter sp. JC074]|uniref:helix-turn-helix domain-containing protein n=1 Tax=Acidaminobacter sp. JC074 TaxID=2530199 RepID=UPI001F0E7944|nr:helix-turn-helix domain-containing protein [Acidaminobacter sp. JC074]MCH4888898.1 helix-turn-helix domain-containing protein [Acidaminobacter sp. JC074]